VRTPCAGAPPPSTHTHSHIMSWSVCMMLQEHQLTHIAVLTWPFIGFRHLGAVRHPGVCGVRGRGEFWGGGRSRRGGTQVFADYVAEASSPPGGNGGGMRWWCPQWWHKRPDAVLTAPAPCRTSGWRRLCRRSARPAPRSRPLLPPHPAPPPPPAGPRPQAAGVRPWGAGYLQQETGRAGERAAADAHRTGIPCFPKHSAGRPGLKCHT
jgi:hypothetical protein